MTVRELIQLLETFDQDSEIIVEQNMNHNGYGNIRDLQEGLLMETNYGNDFLPYEQMLVGSNEFPAVCLFAEAGIHIPPRQEKETSQ